MSQIIRALSCPLDYLNRTAKILVYNFVARSELSYCLSIWTFSLRYVNDMIMKLFERLVHLNWTIMKAISIVYDSKAMEKIIMTTILKYWWMAIKKQGIALPLQLWIQCLLTEMCHINFELQCNLIKWNRQKKDRCLPNWKQ